MSSLSKAAIPDPRMAQKFRFIHCDYEPATGVASLVYGFDNGPELVERITFPHAPWPPEASRQHCFRRSLEILHLVAGVSYYKAGACAGLEAVPVGQLKGVEGFLRSLYVKGLAEFGFVNGLDMAARIQFAAQVDSTGASPATARELILPDRALVAMGGGKDSLVGLQLIREASLQVLPVCVGGSPLIRDTVKEAGLPLLAIGRQLAPELAQMNRQGAYNGHVPVTAINSAILLCASILYGFRYIVFSNERSADEATRLTPDGLEVNHQYSKSSDFEAAFRQVIAAQVSPDIEYFSILRPFSELEVVRRFSGMPRFHDVYSSCNRNFHLDGSRISGRWCLDCPKCRFAALSLALFLPPEAVVAIQGGDLLNDPEQEDGFRALCQLGREKPFECVGEAGESRAAMAALAGREAWSRHVIVRRLRPDLEKVSVPPLQELFELAGKHFIPRTIRWSGEPGDRPVSDG